ncbi:YcaO-like family protein [Nocardiopsis potens]|uniref:YcaO-like family protein n=1 Tax=Nocardiopsis potens TaxID=1246458 RepID=UPI00034690F7|nr:YcaO-like family protein [Nocardiopsis potens]
MSARRPLSDLVSPFGVLSSVRERGFWGPADLAGFVSDAGDPPPSETDAPVLGGGRSSGSAELARLKAIAEGAERYAAADILGEERISASGSEVRGDPAFLEPWRFPQCSAAEYADPRCPLRPFDPEAPIRWVRGTDLHSGLDTWVPAAMATYRLAHKTPSERFAYPVSTGYAVHTDPVEAVLRGLLEVVERDGVGLTWLQRMPLPPADDSARSPSVTGLLEWLERRFVSAHLFDATSDLGVPAVYCLLSSAHDPLCARIVGASAERDTARAAEKALQEAVSVMAIVRARGGDVERIEDFRGIEDGAVYMGRQSRRRAFDFLLDGAGERPRRARAPLPSSPGAALRTVVDGLHGIGARAVRVDRTPKELESVGLTCVNVVVPDLQPMSLDPFAQFKAHRRLFEAPRRMGYEAHDEKGLNPWPQPFA